MAQQQTNFPVSNSPLVDANGILTKEGRTLLRTLWLAGPGATQQLGWATATVSPNKSSIGNYSGSAVPTDLATQVVFLTQELGTLVNALKSYGLLKS